MASADRKVKCRWCPWECPVWFTRPNGGGAVSGFDCLAEHVGSEHPEELEKMRSPDEVDRLRHKAGVDVLEGGE